MGKYIAAFDYAEKTVIVLFVISREISLISLTSVIGVPV